MKCGSDRHGVSCLPCWYSAQAPLHRRESDLLFHFMRRTNFHVYDQVLEPRTVTFNLVDDGLAKLIAFLRRPRPVSEFSRAVLHKIGHPVFSGRRDSWIPGRRYD